MSVSSNYDYYYDEFDDCEISIFSAIVMLLIFFSYLGLRKLWISCTQLPGGLRFQTVISQRITLPFCEDNSSR